VKISVNLATRPFIELRPLLARLRIAMALLAIVAVGLWVGVRALNDRAAVATADMNALKAKTAAYEQQRAANEARMRQPANQAVLQRSQFLNALFARKSFSWTAVMMDLERVLPGGVQVTSIDPVISKEGEVSIRLRVVGDRDRAIQLVRNLELSERFVKPRLAGETAVAADKASALGRASAPGLQNVSSNPNQVLGNDVELEIFSGYNPLSAVTVKHETRPVRVVKTAPSNGPVVKHNRKPIARPLPPAGGAR
jgi:type IV pilus assembly protein PilN